ncbi:MAG: hypothetical protein ACOVS5_01820 [Oligoflexus sp.]|jgi:hypothetical protein
MTALQVLNVDNYLGSIYRFNDRQAGVSLIYDPERELYTYNAYCLETKIMKELFTVECEYLEEALDLINQEFGSWELVELNTKSSGCGSCVAK